MTEIATALLFALAGLLMGSAMLFGGLWAETVVAWWQDVWRSARR